MGIVREDDEEVAVADNQVGAGAVGVAGGVMGLVVRDGLHHLREGFAADEFCADERELDVRILAMGLIPFRVHEARCALAHDGFHSKIQRVRTHLHVGRDSFNVLQRQIQRRRQALVQADVFDVVVNHNSLLFILIDIHRILVVIRAVEVDFDIDIVLGAVDLDGTVLSRRFLELGDLGGAGIGQFIRVLVQRVAVQAMG